MNRHTPPALCFLFLAGVSAHVQTAHAETTTLSEVFGAVSILHSDGTTAKGESGTPLRAGDAVRVESGSRATVRNAANTLRLNWDTALDLISTEAEPFRAKLRRGSVAAEVSLPDAASWTFDTPAGPVTLQTSGAYRIDADPARNSIRLNVHTGRALLGGQFVNSGHCGDLAESGIADLRETEVRNAFDAANWVWPAPGRRLNVPATHEANRSKAAEIVREANNPGSGQERMLAPVHTLIAPPVVGPHATVPIGLPPSGIVIVK